jgi:hypothetical protein
MTVEEAPKERFKQGGFPGGVRSMEDIQAV